MKKLLTLFAAALMMAGCANSFIETDESYVTRSYTAELEKATKTTLEAGGKVSWAAGDVVRYYSKKNGTIGEVTINEAAEHANLDLNVSETAAFLIAVYGGMGLSDNLGSGVTISGAVPAEQSGVFGDNHVALVKTYSVTDPQLVFQNLVSYIKFTLSRTDVKKVVFKANDGTQLHGNGVLKVTLPEETPTASFGEEGGSAIAINTQGAGTFYIATLPCTMANGFTADCYGDGGEYLGSAVTGKSVTLAADYILNLGTIDTRIEKLYTDLSAAGTANCYIVSEPGNYKFKANVKGSSSEAVDGTPYYAEVLWESFGTDETPNEGDVVSGASFKDGYIQFTSGRNGNAVIAVEDRNEDILWSWHIWVCEGYDPAQTDQVYNNGAGTMMDRNLGATSATPGDVGALGLLYQWGRKDPFLGSSSISSATNAASTGTWPSAVSSDASNGTIEYASLNPMTFITYNTSNYDWYYTGSSSTDNTRWQTNDNTKGLYDPCPAGYRVPDGGTSGVWAKAFGISNEWTTSSNVDDTNRGMNFGSTDRTLGSASTIWYPFAGYLDGSGSLFNVSGSGDYWSCSPDDYYACYVTFGNSGCVRPLGGNYRAFGLSVRCLKEGSVQPEPAVTDLSAEGTANCYIVSKAGQYKFKTVKGNSTTSAGTVPSVEVLWESFGTDTAPSVGDLVSGVSYADGYITFTASALKGNAVIAAKDAAGIIRWSWHIWMTDKPEDQVYNNNAGTMMDRNLGATSATPGDVRALGLMYQWGRKDPFLGGCQINYSSDSNQSKAASTGTWPSAADSGSSTGTEYFAVANPTMFINYNSRNVDWYYTGSNSTDNTRWQTSSMTKGLYDPCPVGYRVPDGGSSGVWCKAFGTSGGWNTSTNWDATNKGMNFGATDRKLGSASNIWYPASGYLNIEAGSLEYVGLMGGYGSSTPGDSYYACQLGFLYNGSVKPSYGVYRAYGRSIRCCKDTYSY